MSKELDTLLLGEVGEGDSGLLLSGLVSDKEGSSVESSRLGRGGGGSSSGGHHGFWDENKVMRDVLWAHLDAKVRRRVLLFFLVSLWSLPKDRVDFDER